MQVGEKDVIIYIKEEEQRVISFLCLQQAINDGPGWNLFPRKKEKKQSQYDSSCGSMQPEATSISSEHTVEKPHFFWWTKEIEAVGQRDSQDFVDLEQSRWVTLVQRSKVVRI